MGLAVAIILTLNQRDRTLACLTSLLADEVSSFRVLVWDNGSEDGTEESVREAFPQLLVHRHPTNLGVASGRNAAAELAIETFDPTYLLFLDNDMLVEPGFVNGLLEPFLEDQRVGQTQAKLRFMDDRSRINDGGGAQINFVLWQVTPVGYGEIDNGQYDTVKGCVSCGGAMMVRADVFRQLGGFDRAFDPFGPEDLDFSLRLQEAGYLALYTPQATAYHVVSHTYGKGYSPEYARHKSRHWYVFMRRHASPAQKVGFFLLGAPYMAARAMIREVRRGNIGAFQGLVSGFLESMQASIKRNEGHDG
ncbi:MAG: glycosyltransferase family 2 protein [Chloroflexota bacterium]|nr:MAG: glycosyltransferase family 2 protein [Chloroflexota bacterium]